MVTLIFVRRALVVPFVLVIVLLLIVASGAGAAGSERVARDKASGFTISVPSGWRAEFATDPNFVGAWVGSRMVQDQDEAGCSGSDFTMVSVRVSEDDDVRSDASTYGPRPVRFRSSSGGGVVSGYDDQDCEMRNQHILFVERGRRLRASLTFGRDASERRIAEAYSILGSLKVTDPGPSPWSKFCAAAAQLDLTRLDLASEPRFGAQIDAMRSAAPERSLDRSLETVAPVITNPSVATDELRVHQSELNMVGVALSRHCDLPRSIFSILLRSRLAQGG